MSLCCTYTVGYKWVSVMDGIKFEFNDLQNIIISIRKTILSGDGLSV